MHLEKKSYFNAKNAVFFIAEIGGNHEGNYKYAQKLTRLALDSGADAIKFQFYTGDTLVSRLQDADRNAHFKSFELSNKQNQSLLKMVDDNGAIPMASVWSKDMLEWSDNMLPIHKVGSGDLTHYKILSSLADTDKPIILSTGLSSMTEVENAVSYIDKCNASYVRNRKLALLHCTSSYPTPDEDANLAVIETLKREFDLPVGYSDHTIGSEAIEAAVAMGAEIIEKHFTDTREGKTFRDHLIALTKCEVKKSLAKMSRISSFRGLNEKKLTKSEFDSGHHISFRRSIYLVRDIRAGSKISEEDLTVLRPMHGVCASEYDQIIGKIALRDLSAGEPLQRQDFQG